MNIDRKLFLMLYNFTQKRVYFNKIVRFIDRICPIIFAVIFITLCVYLMFVGKHMEVLLFICGPFITLVICRLVRHLTKRPRPCQMLKINSPHIGKTSYSFPSNHAASAAAIAFACMLTCVPIGAALLFLAAVTALSRVFTGAHYLSDILGGFAVAAIVIAISFWIFKITVG